MSSSEQYSEVMTMMTNKSVPESNAHSTLCDICYVLLCMFYVRGF